MARPLRVEHDAWFDLVPEANLDGRDSLGVRTTLGANGEESRHLVRTDAPSYTDIDLPDDYSGRPTEIVHLIDTLNDRHLDKATGVYGDPEVGPKVAALLGCDYKGEALPDASPPPAPAATPAAPASVEGEASA